MSDPDKQLPHLLNHQIIRAVVETLRNQSRSRILLILLKTERLKPQLTKEAASE